MERSSRFWLLAILSLAIFLRFFRLDHVPGSLFIDEIDLGYQARSLLATGHDYRGYLSPFYVRSYNSDRTLLPAYLTALSTLIFTTPEYQVRGGAAIAGTITVLLAFLLVKLWTKNNLASLMAALVFAVSPWQLQFSRIAFEGTTLSVVVLAGIVWFFYWQKTQKLRDFFIAIILLSLSIYTYRTMSLFTPVLFLLLLGIYRDKVFALGWRNLLAAGLVATVIIGSFLYATTKASADQPRFSQISIFSDPMVPINVMRNRERASGDYQRPDLGKQAVVWSKMIYNKPVGWLDKLGDNYLSAFSSQFLFAFGDPNLRHSVGGTGMLLAVDIIGLIGGIIFLKRFWPLRQYQFLVGLLILSPLPAALTEDGANHAHRLFIFSLPLLLILGLGWWQILSWLKNRNVLATVIGGLWLANFCFYLIKYYVAYPYTSARSFGYGYQQAMDKIVNLKDQYEGVVLTQAIDPPMGYYWFWAQVPPQEVAAYGTDFSQLRPDRGPLGRVSALSWPQTPLKPLAANFEPGILYLLTTREIPLDLRGKDPVPPGLRLLDTIKYPDNEVAFYLVTLE